MVGTANGDVVNYQNITSCISPLGNAHGKHIVTMEGINLLKRLNTVQQAMADNYANPLQMGTIRSGGTNDDVMTKALEDLQRFF